MGLLDPKNSSGPLLLLVLVLSFADLVLSAVAATGENDAADPGQYLRRSLADEIVETQRPLGLGSCVSVVSFALRVGGDRQKWTFVTSPHRRVVWLVACCAGTGLFAIVVFFFIFVIAFIAGIFLEKLRGALIGGGLCMLVTVTLFVALAPRGPKYVDDQVEGADAAGYNFLGS